MGKNDRNLLLSSDVVIKSYICSSKSSLLIIGLIIIIMISVTTSLNTETDKAALLAFKSGLVLDPNNSTLLAKNWSADNAATGHCNWLGVSCGARHGRVTALVLPRMGLRGSIARDIGNLSFLVSLRINGNGFYGDIPQEMGRLKRLKSLFMGANQLSGKIPPSFGFLNNLQVLNLAENRLTGNVPKEISNLSSLEVLALGWNNLTGNIWSEFGKLSSLRKLSLVFNNLVGSIPASIANISNLEMLDIGHNSINGDIPSQLGHLSNLTEIYLNFNKFQGEFPRPLLNISVMEKIALIGNKFSGNLPSDLAYRLPNIKGLYLATNNFSGQIPPTISNATRLEILDLGRNFFSGYIPTTLGNLGQLRWLSLQFNLLGNDPSTPEMGFLVSLTKSNKLQTLQIGNNPLNGIFPRSFPFGNLSISFKSFLATNCGIKGKIPVEIGNLTKLLWLSFSDNYMTGTIPPTLGNLKKLQRLNLGENRLDGRIPASICNLKDLYFLALNNNKLSGNIPICLGNLSSLTELYLASNQFVSTLPPSLWLNNKIQILDLSSNHLSGSISPDVGSLISVTDLYLSKNQFTGEIPSSFGQLQHLVNLSLSMNMLHGAIPQSFGFLVGLEYLDLSKNNLSGTIPISLEKLKYLVYFNVSFNHLAGEKPDGGPFKNFSVESFMGNDGLCGVQLRACESPELGESRKLRSLLKYVLPPLGLILVLAIFVIFVLRFRTRNTKLLDGTSLEPNHFMRKRISYYDMLRATDNFDESNLIGRGSYGSVYKAKFGDGVIAAIKVFNLDSRAPFKSFDAECKAMRDIRHRNLVKVIGICSNLDIKALVLEYMPNGSLERWLYSFNYCLDFVKRMEIMLDVASALEYLHHNYLFPIVHCDLKPSNVLLDGEMVGHLGDFGLAKILSLQNQTAQTDTLGTIGYMAPEYGTAGIVSAMGDVYSYGILMAETFTRKKPTDEMFSGELTMEKWISESFPGNIMKIVDDNLVVQGEENLEVKQIISLKSIMELVVQCIQDLPENRINMKQVVDALKKIISKFHQN